MSTAADERPVGAARTQTADLALVRRHPTVALLPRHPLTCLPTPVQPLDQLARRCNLPPLWIKRDDVSGPLYGGNKPRKLEWLLGDALAYGRRGVITFGGIGTHHGLATAICARDAGLRAVLVLLPQPVTEHVLQCLLADHAAGAELHLRESVAGIVAGSLALCGRAIARGKPLAIIPTGGTSAAGVIGYVNAAFELAEQVRAGEMPEPAAIFVPLGSGGTVAGLALGCRLAGLRSRVVAVLVTDILPPSVARLARIARAGLRRLRRVAPELPDVTIGPADLTIVDHHVGPAYGAVTEAGLSALHLLHEEEGVGLETTYTAKCLAALLEMGPALGQCPLLFWNTFSSVDLAPVLGPLPDWHALPPAFHRFFESRTT